MSTRILGVEGFAMKISPSETLTRFIRYGSHFSLVNMRVKYHAFIPPKKSADLSVFCISSLSNNEAKVWEIGAEYIHPLKARADLPAGVVYDIRLKVVPDTQPHELHANITSFPIGDSPADRRTRQTNARKLAASSKLVPLPDSLFPQRS